MATNRSVQDAFLKSAIEHQAVMRINLINGKNIVGSVVAFDNFTVLVTSTGGAEVLIYKGAIGAVGPNEDH